MLNEHATPLDLGSWIEHADREAAAACVGITEVALELPVKTSIEDSKADAEQCLQRGLQQIATAMEGGRHKTYSRIAYTCGGLVSAAALEREETLKKR